MAEGTLFNVARGIIEKAGDLALQEIALIGGVKDEIYKLKETVSTIAALLMDAEAKQHDSEEIRLWLKRLKDAMFDADDLLDEISTEALRWEVMTLDKKAKEVRIFFSKFNPLAYGHKMGHNVKAMRERLYAIAADRNSLGLEERYEEEQVEYVPRQQICSVVSAEDVIGREEDKKAIIGSLLDPDVEENVSVLPIVGVEGLGKTAVAQLVFNDEEIKNHFERKLWVYVSDDFDVKIIVQKIIECVENKKPEDLEMNTLVNDLQEKINGKRYLLVLDDVWNEDREKWFSLKNLLMGGARGSRIVVTTRNERVAKISQSIKPYVLQGLNEQNAWSLFKKMAFVEGEGPRNPSFVNIGEEILKKCKGIPLAIRTIGCRLFFKNSEIEWLSFKNNELSKIFENGKFHLDERSEEEQVRYKARQQTHSVVRAEDVIGREDDKKAIIESLLNPNVRENVSVLPIVGIGGLGKTTVAQLVFNDEEIKNHFELKLWVCVSNDFDVKIIVKKILECIKNKKPKDLEMNTLVNNLQKEINGKRYLLVLDDVWNEDRKKWLRLKDILMGGARGSGILLTTRNERVAEIAQSIQPYVLQGLNEQNAWSLFKKMAFEEGEGPRNSSFVNIEEEILKKCMGIPLAIRTIGGLLYFKKSEIEWLSFKNNELLKIFENGKFHLDERSEEEQVRYKARQQTHSVVRAEDVIGREDDKKAIIESLLNPNVRENVSVLSIVGIGGLGKTTVAQLVFNDEEIKNHFELKLWVCVSVDFDVKIIVEKILECIINKKPKDLELKTLVNNLQKEINGKRYLLVLDDVWNEDREKWLTLKNILMGGARGSRILLTTRIKIVAEITQTMRPHLLNGLDEQQSWSLLKKMAFKEGEELKSASFENIGKEILKKCGGVPLAIRAIGGLLYLKKSVGEWQSFKDNELLNISGDDILPTLKLSYDHLAPHLKQCFAYCSLFPKDYKIDKSSLINMWMAQGFITLYDKKQCLEDVGNEYFMDLLWRSFFQEVEEDELGNISKFKIQNLMHDMAIQVTESESTTIYSKEKDIDEKTRHVSFGDTLYSLSEIPISLYKARRIRTFLLPCQSKFGTIKLNDSTYSAIIASFKFIRLLDMHNMRIKTIPSSIKKLKHLRYLDLSKNEDIEMLPNSIVKLYNLQTLKLSGCYKLKELPRDINKLVNLRFLEIDECSGLTHMPNGLGQLTNLQTLSRFVISKGRIDSMPRSIGGLKELDALNELRGKLSIENLKQVKDAALEYKDANLKKKQCLDRLDLNWVENVVDETVVSYDNKSLEALQPHINLKALSLKGYWGLIFPCWFLSLTNLVEFKLDSCKKCQYLSLLDQLPSLKIIYLDGLDCLVHILDSERYNDGSLFYPSLETLCIWDCPNLKGWWQGRRDSLPSFPRLSNLEIRDCPQLTSFPLFPYLKSLRLINCSLKQSLERMMINNKTLGNLPSIASSSSSSSSTIVAPLSQLSYMRIEEALPKECLPNLISLRTLSLDKCPFPQGMQYLTTLQHLRVWNSEVVDLSNDRDEMEWQGLRSLLSLEFYFLQNLDSLPIGLQYVSSLQNLKISECPRLRAIPEWIYKLTSLQSLKIWDCPNLESLPEGFRALTSLQTLNIEGCPILLKRCKEQIGEDWLKICHIPNLKGDLSRQE